MNISDSIGVSDKLNLKVDQFAFDAIKFAQGTGAAIRYANELRAVQQVSRLSPLRSSNLHEDVLKGNLGPGRGLKEIFDFE